MTSIGRAAILGMIPHQGAMCLLDEVLEWDGSRVRCLSRRYAQADNPLRRADGRLGSACGIEIAAQAMAVHGRLAGGESGAPVPGLLVSLREVRLEVPFLSGAVEPLLVEARRLMENGSGATYEFTVSAAAETWLGGRATVLFGAKQ